MATEEQTQYNDYISPYAARHTVGQRCTIPNRKVTKLGFWMYRDADPYSGDVTFEIRRVSDDSLICSKLWGDRTELPTETTYEEVEFDSPQTINEEVRLLCRSEVGATGHNIYVGFQNTDVKGNEYLTGGDAGSWTDWTGYDCAYRYTYSTPAFVGSQGYIIGA